MINLRNFTQSVDIPVKSITFPAGERHVSVDKSYLRSRDRVYMEIDFKGSDDVVDMMMLREILSDHEVVLSLNYTPFARQDRAVNAGEVNALKVFARLVNSLNFQKVLVTDPHSDVVEAVFDRVVIIRQWDVVDDVVDRGYDYIISPDLGATKKAEKYADLTQTPLLQCTKKRDLKTGKIIKFEVIELPDLTGKRVLILDDICDAGGTFLALSDAIGNCLQKDLYVSHGIFSKGIDILLEKYDNVFCPNVMNHEVKTRFVNNKVGE